jgi:D-alanyl-lipoteichoic acid acyltransferase DltB (MBOAT superfamily)
MNTMLLGGLWHGASWNFMIWGGLNGIGMIVFRFWKDWDHPLRLLSIGLLTWGIYELTQYFPAPIWNIALVWSGAICLGTFLRFMYNFIGWKNPLPWLERSWAVLQTFVFITWTRLFFRAGSNLDPAEANEVAWNTAKNMVHQMGTAWRVDMIFPIAWEHINIILVFIAGMLIHWIPKRVKSRYRIIFASLPIPLMVLATAFIIFIIYQFMSADSCPFIYFQF